MTGYLVLVRDSDPERNFWTAVALHPDFASAMRQCDDEPESAQVVHTDSLTAAGRRQYAADLADQRQQ